MKNLLILAIFALGVTTTVNAEDQKPKTELEQKMGLMGESLKAIATDLEASVIQDTTFEKSKTLSTGILESIPLTPKTFAPITDEKQRALATIAFQKQLGALFSKSLELQEALVQKDIAKANAVIAELVALKKQGHQDFKGH